MTCSGTASLPTPSNGSSTVDGLQGAWTRVDVRVIAGSAKGTRLGAVPSRTRPLSDRAREGLFSSLGPATTGARVLDLFAGTGALGIEALSRGAESATFVDSSVAAVKTIQENLSKTRLSDRGSVFRLDAEAALARDFGRFDLLFLDPPYRLDTRDVEQILVAVSAHGVAAPAAIVALTRRKGSSEPVVPLDWTAHRRLRYGDAVVHVFRTP